MSVRLAICFAFCLAFYSCSSSGNQKFYGSKLESTMKNGADLYFYDFTVEEDINFIDTAGAARVSPVVSDVSVRSAIVFRNCTFKGKVIAFRKQGDQSYTTTFRKNIFFEDCVFDEEVNFEGSTVMGNCNFLKCTFKKGGLFNRSTFNSMASFTGCTFMEDAGFQQCTYMGNAFFNEAHFYRSAFFQNSYFYREATFNLVNADGYTDFSLVNFYSTANFNYGHFKKNLVFNDGTFRGKTQFVGSEFFRAQYEGCIFYSRTDFDKSTYSDMLTLKDAKFLTSIPSSKDYKATKLIIDGAEVSGSKLIGF